ncbi:hypothetical protein N507_2221 [Lacticaseibacillus rhamnosus DSM 14870]|nr:hypothetical protein N507_2221 [Lacticaseibacillus rhamnosus DSM 14870]
MTCKINAIICMILTPLSHLKKTPEIQFKRQDNVYLSR